MQIKSRGAIKIGGYTGGRGNGGYSLRESLISQGVTLEGAMRQHIGLVYGTLQAVPTLDITRYRVDPNNPNGLPQMG